MVRSADPAGKLGRATGTYIDGESVSRRVAVSIGPEHGTVGPLQIKNAAIEAVRGLGHDVLIVCGFAFDAQADEAAKQFGELVVLPTRMNPDLLMGDELLKKTGAGSQSYSKRPDGNWFGWIPVGTRFG